MVISSSFNPVEVICTLIFFFSPFLNLLSLSEAAPHESLETLEQTSLWSVLKGKLVFTACTTQLNPLTSHKRIEAFTSFYLDVCRYCRSGIRSLNDTHTHIYIHIYIYIYICIYIYNVSFSDQHCSGQHCKNSLLMGYKRDYCHNCKGFYEKWH